MSEENDVVIKGAAMTKEEKEGAQVFSHTNERIPIENLLEKIEKAEDLSKVKAKTVTGKDRTISFSKQGVNLGRKPHPFNMQAVVDFQDVNVHHARCLRAKTAATVGLGFRRPDEIPRNIPLAASDTVDTGQFGEHELIETVDEQNTLDANGKVIGKKTTTSKVPTEDAKKKRADAEAAKKSNQPNKKVKKADDATPAPTDPNKPPEDGEKLLLDPTAAMVDRQKPSKVDEVLDPLCEVSFQDVLNDVAEDYWQCGAGAIEVVRKGGPGTEITGLHHIPIATLWIFMEDEFYNFHYEIESGEGTGFARRFARWGDSAALKERAEGGFSGGMPIAESTDGLGGTSEVIYFRRPSSKHRFYGYPDWLSAVTAVELVKCQDQYKYDFFNNRGVPEFMLFIIGTTLQPAEWGKIKTAVQSNIGQGNSHKTTAINLTGDPETIKVQLEKLAMEGVGADDYVSSNDCLALKIVTAHGVPPLLAGIQIPGKLGANNELPNSLMAFHTLVTSPAQRLFRRVLSNTLGSKEANLGLTPDDFSFRTIVEEIDVGTMETISRMRQDLRGARAEGRPMDGTMKD